MNRRNTNTSSHKHTSNEEKIRILKMFNDLYKRLNEKCPIFNDSTKRIEINGELISFDSPSEEAVGNYVCEIRKFFFEDDPISFSRLKNLYNNLPEKCDSQRNEYHKIHESFLECLKQLCGITFANRQGTPSVISKDEFNSLSQLDNNGNTKLENRIEEARQKGETKTINDFLGLFFYGRYAHEKVDKSKEFEEKICRTEIVKSFSYLEVFRIFQEILNFAERTVILNKQVIESLSSSIDVKP